MDSLDGQETHWQQFACVGGLQNLKHRCQVTSLSVFHRIHFGECAQIPQNFILFEPLHTLRRTKKSKNFLLSVLWFKCYRETIQVPCYIVQWGKKPSKVDICKNSVKTGEPSDYTVSLCKRWRRFDFFPVWQLFELAGYGNLDIEMFTKDLIELLNL